jgi:DHA1 family inner membrane transport protein
MAERSGPETGAERPPSFGLAPAEFALALGGFALGTGEFASMGLLPDIARSAGVSIPTAGMAISAYALGVVVGAPLIAVVFAKAGRRTMLVALMLAFALANIMTALSTAFGIVVLARFLAGLPHGAYFGFAALAAAAMAPPSGRAKAIGRVMLGLSVANVVGVPLATWVGQRLGWNAAFVLVAAVALTTAGLARLCLPPMPAHAHASPLRELRGLRQPQLWLTLGIAAIGFGGLFAVYSYVSPMLTQVTGVTEAAVPLFLAVIGTGMVGGSLFGGWFADRGLLRAIGVILALNILVLAALPFTASSPALVGINLFLMGFAALSLAPALQTRLMDVAGSAQTLAASLNHSAFNVANALGAWLGGICVTAGLGWTCTGPLGACLAAGGLLILLASRRAERRSKVLLPSET